MNKNLNIFSDELIETLENKKEKNATGDILKRICDGEPKDINPLTEIPELNDLINKII